MRRENYKSDLRVVVTLTVGGTPIGVPAHDFALRFFTEDSRRHYVCQRKGDKWENCKAEGDKVLCLLDNHHLDTGVLNVEYYDWVPDADFTDGSQLRVTPQTLDIELVDGAGDDAAQIDVAVAADFAGIIRDIQDFVAGLSESVRAAVEEVLSCLRCDEDGFYYTDAAGNVAFRYRPGDGLDAATVSEHLKNLVLSRLVSAEDGLYYADAAGNVAMKYTSAGFDVAKLSEHFLGLLPEVKVPDTLSGGGGEVRELKMLCVGNSYTLDEISYLPWVLKQMVPNLKLKIGVFSSGSSTVGMWWVQRESAAIIGTPTGTGTLPYKKNTSGGFIYPCYYTEWATESGVWSDTTGTGKDTTLSLCDALESEDWDVVTFQQASHLAKDYSAIQTPLASLAEFVREKSPGAKVAWLMTHVWSDDYAGYYASPQWSETSDTRWAAVKDVVKMIVDSGVVDFVIPSGTAIQNLRQVASVNALGDYVINDRYKASNKGSAGLSYDGSHLQEGLGPLCASMCVAAVLTKLVPDVWLKYSQDWQVQQSSLDGSHTAVGETAEYEALACWCALNAVLRPWQLTVDTGTALAGKQSTISDLDTIRSGAAAGATALQSCDVPEWAKASSKPSYSYSEISGTPTLAAVATSGAYSDLSGAPSVTDNLTSTSSTNALSANQGKVLKGLLDCYCPIVEDTRASAVAAITGVAPFASLVGGQRVLLRLKYGMSNYSTLNLTLSTGDATGAKTMWSSSTYNSKSDAFGGINAGSCYEFVYDATEDKWIMVGQRDTNTTYLNVTNDNIANSAVGRNTINGKILRDNFYLKSETDTLLAAKASTSDLAAKADVVAKVVLEVWYTDAELTYWSGTDAFTRQELEAALDNYYEGWDDDEDNVDIVDTIMTSPASPVEIERMSKKMAGALNTISDEFDIEDKGGFSVTATAEQSNIPSVPMKLVTFDASVSYTASDLADAIDTLTGSTSWRNATDLAAVEVIAASCPNDVDVVMTDEFAGVLDECAADEGFFEDFGGILVSSSTYECYQISPNTFYDFGTQNKLYLDFVAGTPGVVNIYAFRFKFNASSSQLNLPASVEWLDDAPEAAAGRRVEVSVMDNLGVFTAKDLEE